MIGASEISKLVTVLLDAVFQNAEIVFFQIGDELAVFGGDHHTDVHQRHVNFDGVVRHALNFLRLGWWRRRRRFFLLLGDGVGSNIVLRPTRFWRRLLFAAAVAGWTDLAPKLRAVRAARNAKTNVINGIRQNLGGARRLQTADPMARKHGIPRKILMLV